MQCPSCGLIQFPHASISQLPAKFHPCLGWLCFKCLEWTKWQTAWTAGRLTTTCIYILVVKRKVPVAARATPWLQSHNACHGQMPITTKASQLHTRYMGHTFYIENVFRCTVCVRKLLNIDFNYNSFNALDGSDASQYMQHQRNSSSHQIHAYIPARTMALCSFVAADAVGRNISTPQNKAKWKRYIDI